MSIATCRNAPIWGSTIAPDHSLRIPRPDLSINLGAPNACNRCHADKTAQWADQTITRWYGPGRRAHYGTVIAEGRKGSAQVRQDLIKLALDPLYPVIVRSTALSLLAAYPGEDTNRAYELALMDDEALIRRTALDHLRVPDRNRQSALLVPMLYDPVKAVRTEAGRRMTEISEPKLDESQKNAFQAALRDYQISMEYSADFAFGRYNLANLYTALRQSEKAVENFRAAIKIDHLFYPAKVNLAMLLNQEGRKGEAERLLREVVVTHPQLYEIHYSLGLLLAEEKKYSQAADHLSQAAEGLPARARIHYNLGLLRQHLAQDSDAEASLLKAKTLEPDNIDYLYAVAHFYLERKRWQEARTIADEMIARHPSQKIGHDLLDLIMKGSGALSN